jgi:hypothetical protein
MVTLDNKGFEAAVSCKPPIIGAYSSNYIAYKEIKNGAANTFWG